MKKIIFVIIMEILVVCVSAKENVYKIKGYLKYSEVLEILSMKSRRSVVGDVDCLEKSRYWFINDKKFYEAVKQLEVNLYTDGYRLEYDENAFEIYKIEEDKERKNKKIYKVFKDYENRWLVTESQQEYLNAKIIDRENEIRDSIRDQMIQIDTIYKCSLRIIGIEKSGNNGYEINVKSPLQMNLRLGLDRKPNFNTGISINKEKTEYKYDFDRKMIFFINDTEEVVLNFGSEERRVKSKIESDRILTESYESIFDGLRITANKSSYKLKYRVQNSEINLKGVPGVYVRGSVRIEAKSGRKQFFLIPSSQKNYKEYEIVAILIIEKR